MSPFVRNNIPPEVRPLLPKKNEGQCSYAMFMAVLVGGVCSMAEGYDLGNFGAIAATLRAEFGINAIQMGILSGVPMFCQAGGNLLGGSLAGYCGRKVAFGCVCILLVGGTVVQGLAKSYLTFALGRCLVMFSGGAGLPVVSAYMTEVTPAALRGRICALEEVLLMMGITMAYAASWSFLGIAQGWRLVVLLGVISPGVCLCLILFCSVPESPRYLLIKGRRGEAEHVLRQLIRDPDEVTRTLESWDAVSSNGACPPVSRRALVACFGVCCGNTLSGVTVLHALLTYVLRMVLDGKSSADWALIINASKFLMALPVCFYWMDTVGRRPLMIGSAVAMACGAAISLWSLHGEVSAQLFSVGMCIHLTFFSFGLGPAPWVYGAEVLPNERRAQVLGLALFISRLFTAVQLLALPLLVETFIWMPFAFYIFCNCMTAIFIWNFCPETKDKPLEEITAAFEKGG